MSKKKPTSGPAGILQPLAVESTKDQQTQGRPSHLPATGWQIRGCADLLDSVWQIWRAAPDSYRQAPRTVSGAALLRLWPRIFGGESLGYEVVSWGI